MARANPPKKGTTFFAKLSYSVLSSGFLIFRHSDEESGGRCKILVSLQRYATISAQRNKNRVAHADYKLRMASSSAALAQKVVKICEKFVKKWGRVTEEHFAKL